MVSDCSEKKLTLFFGKNFILSPRIFYDFSSVNTYSLLKRTLIVCAMMLFGYLAYAEGDPAASENPSSSDSKAEPNSSQPKAESTPPEDAIPEDEPLSKETQQEKALYELNAYFENYMDPRPFVVGSTEF